MQISLKRLVQSQYIHGGNSAIHTRRDTWYEAHLSTFVFRELAPETPIAQQLPTMSGQLLQHVAGVSIQWLRLEWWMETLFLCSGICAYDTQRSVRSCFGHEIRVDWKRVMCRLLLIEDIDLHER